VGDGSSVEAVALRLQKARATAKTSRIIWDKGANT
jgi:hypothetical protein